MTSNGKFVVDENGNRIGVLLDIKEYQEFMSALEELESIRAYDAAKSIKDETVPFDQAVSEIQRSRE